jgi:beta-lactamase regulating signal transducer with metallopeptidase domain
LILENIFASVLRVSLTTGVVILAVILLSSRLNRRYVAKWKYWLWLLLGVRLLVPFNLELPSAPVKITVPERVFAPAPIVGQAPVAFAPAGPVAAAIDPAPQALSAMELLGLAWLCGIAVFLLWQIAVYLTCKRQVLRWARVPGDARLMVTLEQLCAEMGLAANITLLINPKASSPMMIGFVRNYLILPQEDYSAVDLVYILRHELVHLKRRDLWYKLLLLIVNAAHWFNPAAWLLLREAGKDLEIYCDDEVLRGLSPEQRQDYGDAILRTIHRQVLRNTALSTCFSGKAKTLKERFSHILTGNKKRRGILLGAAILACAALVGGAVALDMEPESDTANIPADAVPMEVELGGGMGKLSFMIPKEFGGKLEASVQDNPIDGLVLKYIQLRFNGRDDVEPSFDMMFSEQAVIERWKSEAGEGRATGEGLEILSEDGYRLGYYNLSFNPFENEPESDEFALMQNYSDLRKCIVDSIAWIKSAPQAESSEISPPPVDESAATENREYYSNLSPEDEALVQILTNERGLTESQIRSLSNMGLSFQEMIDLADEEIARMLAPGSRFMGDYMTGEETDRLVASGIAEEDVWVLGNLGYIYESAAALTPEELDFIFPNTELVDNLVARGYDRSIVESNGALYQGGYNTYRDLLDEVFGKQKNYQTITFPASKPFHLTFELPLGWTLKERGVTGSSNREFPFLTVQSTLDILDGAGELVGAVGYNTYEEYEGAEEDPRAIYGQIALGNNYKFDVRDSYDVITESDSGKTATCNVYYSANINNGEEKTNLGIVSYNRDLRAYVAFEFSQDKVTEAKVLNIAESIRLTEAALPVQADLRADRYRAPQSR